MFIILPNKVEEKMTQLLFDEIIAEQLLMEETNLVRVEIPRFKIESNSKMKSQLVSAFGVKEMFSAKKADFSGITHNHKELSLTQIFHKSILQVNEEGNQNQLNHSFKNVNQFHQ